uniref:Uncharacterized protein n=1 Tax=Panagrolaimus sp. PS1159 TaxID=55785 RepID=A0AC35G7Y0_9BILA
MPILMVYTICNSAMISGWLVYFVVYFCSRKFFKNAKTQTVSERYQRHENMKTHKTMCCFAASCIISLFLVTIYINLLRYYQVFFPSISEINMIALLRICIDTIQAYLLFFIPTAFIFTHDKLKTKYLGIFKLLKAQHRISPTPQNYPVVKSLTGQNMIIKDEQEYYFRSLTTEWEGELQNNSFRRK